MIIGVTGTNGAGKGTVVEYFVKTRGFTHYSARTLLLEEIERRGISRDRTNARIVGNDLRKQHGPDYIARALYQKAALAGGHAVIESIRTLGEARFLKEKGAKILGVDADRKLRYERSLARGSETDNVSFEEFCAQEDREMSSADEWDMNVFGVLNMADAVVMNDTTKEELFAQLDAALANLGV